jgi:hypothetical protein
MSLNRTTTALILGALLAAPALIAAPAMAAEPGSRAECRIMDPQSLTAFCQHMLEIDAWRQQIMDDTGATDQGGAVPTPVGPLGPDVDWAFV